MNTDLPISLNLKKVLYAAEKFRDINSELAIYQESVFWAFYQSDSSPFFWMSDNCGVLNSFKFIQEFIPKDSKSYDFDDQEAEDFFTDGGSLEQFVYDKEVLTDLKNAYRISKILKESEISPEAYIYASFCRKSSLFNKFFIGYSPASERSKVILKKYLTTDCSRDSVASNQAATEDMSPIEESMMGQLLQESLQQSKTKKTKSFLEKFCRNLNVDAESGKIDKVVGRERETAAVITVLTRKNKNNPVLVGEAGVGKTSIAENLAAKIVSQECNPLLWDKVVYELKMSSIVSDATLRGQFEERLEGIVKEACKFSNIILYIDELHTLVGAGSGMNSPLDASNMLKPYLARGELMLLGSTTTDEYRQHIRNDKALDRRFQKITVQEPTKEECVQILEGIIPDYEDYHGVTFPKELIRKVVDLSDKFVPNKNFPDKAIDILDETCSFVKTNHWEYPDEMKEINKDVQNLTDEDVENNLLEIMSKYDKYLDEWSIKVTIPPEVTEDDIYDLFYQKFNISKILLNRSGRGGLTSLESSLQKNTFGQKDSIKEISSYIKRKHIGLEASNSGSMFSLMFSGPKGCGKEYLARQLSSQLFSGPDSFFYFNCESFSEEALIEAFNKGSFCTVYFDKFDPDDSSYNKFFETMICDGYILNKYGERVWCKHCCIILASSAESSNKCDIGFSESSNVKRELCPYVDKIIKLSKIDKSLLKNVAVDRACEILDKISCKFGNIKVKYTRPSVEEAVKNFIGENIFLDTLDGEISDFLSNKLCDKIVDLSSSGGSLEVDDILLNEGVV